jgi:hypothetical protein
MALVADEPTDEEKLQKLPEDGETPFRPAKDVSNHPEAEDPLDRANPQAFDDTHPATDTGMQPEEQYEEGVAGASEAREPEDTPVVGGYEPQPDNIDHQKFGGA